MTAPLPARRLPRTAAPESRASKRQPVHDRSAWERANTTKREDTLALCGGDGQQVPHAASGGLMRRLRADRQRRRAKSCNGAPPPIRNLSKPIRLGLSSRAARNPVNHGVDLGDHKLGRGVLHLVADIGQYDQFRPCGASSMSLDSHRHFYRWVYVAPNPISAGLVELVGQQFPRLLQAQVHIFLAPGPEDVDVVYDIVVISEV